MVAEALDESARKFYLHHEFIPLPEHPQNFLLRWDYPKVIPLDADAETVLFWPRVSSVPVPVRRAILFVAPTGRVRRISSLALVRAIWKSAPT